MKEMLAIPAAWELDGDRHKSLLKIAKLCSSSDTMLQQFEEALFWYSRWHEDDDLAYLTVPGCQFSILVGPDDHWDLNVLYHCEPIYELLELYARTDLIQYEEETPIFEEQFAASVDVDVPSYSNVMA